MSTSRTDPKDPRRRTPKLAEAVGDLKDGDDAT